MRVQFGPPPGLSSDDTPFAAPGVYEDASLIRFWEGKPEVRKGWTDALNGSTLSGVCRNLLSWKTSGGVLQVAFGTHTHLQLFKSGSLHDITPAGLAAGSINGSLEGPGWGSGPWGSGPWGGGSGADYWPRTWAMDTYGDWLIANPRREGIYQWTGDTAVVATAVTNAPAEVTYTIVTPSRQIMALGCNEETSGTFNPMCIRWSDIEAITTWTTSATNNAGEHILKGGSRIVAARVVGPHILVWTDTAVHLGTFIGDPQQTFRFDLIGSDCGLIGPNAFAILNQTAHWMGSDRQPRIMELGAAPQTLPFPISRDFTDNLVTVQADKIVAATTSQYGEVEWFYPDARDGDENSRYIVFGSEESRRAGRPVWSKGILARTAGIDAGATTFPIRVTYGGNVYYHEDGVSAAGSAIEWFIKSGHFYLDKGGQAMMLTSFEPDFEEQDDSVTLTVTSRQYPKASEVTHGPYTITTDATKKDFRASGKLISVKFSGSSTTPSMRLGLPTFVGEPTGRR